MKYNKQLFDHLNGAYLQALSLAEFIFDNLIEKQEEISRFSVMENFDAYIQGSLAKIVLDSEPKNPSLFNMLKKLNKYTNFYQGVGLDDWFTAQAKVLSNIKKKAKNVTNSIPVVVQIVKNIDSKTKRTEFSMQLLEALVNLSVYLLPESKDFEDVEKTVLNKYFKDIYEYVSTTKKTK